MVWNKSRRSAYNATDRLPTISASEALQQTSFRRKALSTSLPSLDQALCPEATAEVPKGLPRGLVSEIYGPPGVGKTALAMQAAVNALRSTEPRNGVVWIDTGAPLPGPRLEQMFFSHGTHNGGEDPPSSPPVSHMAEDLLDNMSYFNPPTLAHLLILFLHPTSKFPPPGTALIVLDNVSAPFTTAFPRSVDGKISSSSFADAARKTTHQKAANRKWAVAGDLASAMAKMAKLHDVAILVINQVATSIKGLRKATLKPALSGQGWEAGIHNRIMLFRDFAPSDSAAGITDEEARSLRFAKLSKVVGKVKATAAEDVVAFVIENVSSR